MKVLTSIIIFAFSFIFLSNINPFSPPQTIEGGWETTMTQEDGSVIKLSTIVRNGYWATTAYNAETQTFYFTIGGRYTIENDQFIHSIDFHSDPNEKTGSTTASIYKFEDGKLSMDTNPYVWTRVDTGDQSPLSGAWFFAGRMNNGEMSRRPLGPRKTMKILSDTRFQWIAYNDETGGFFGTGGGTYTNLDGKYVENIEFFSRDSSRVGATLSFDFEIKDEEWHHSGFSSKGDPMYEIWAPYEKIEKIAE